MANINKTPWEVGLILVCMKCGAKFNEPGLAEEVKSTVRKKQKGDETQGKIRVIPSGCLNICYPEKQTIAYVPVDGKTEIYTTELNKETIIKEVTDLIDKKISG